VRSLPGRTLGKFAHFRQKYVSSSATGVWVQAVKPGRLLLTNGIANAIGALAWVKDSVPWLRNIPLPFSWADHSPANYIEISQNSLNYKYHWMVG